MKDPWSVFRLAVVAVWIGLVATLVHRGDERARTGTAPAVLLPAAPSPDSEWMGVYLNNKKIGYSRQTFRKLGTGYRFEQFSLMRVSVMNVTQNVRVTVDGETGPDFALQTFSASLTSGVGDFAARGHVEGKELVVAMRMGKEETTQRLPLDEPIYLPASARRYLSNATLQPGRELTMRVFDPSTMTHQPMKVTVEGEEELPLRGGEKVKTWRVREEFRGVQNTVWFDPEGRVLREAGPLNMVAQRESADEAVAAGWESDVAFDLMAAVAIHVTGNLPAPRLTKRLELRLNGIPDFPVPDDERQRRVGAVLVIEREEAGAGGTYPLPYRDERWRAELASGTFLQTEHPRIRQAMHEAVQNEADARKASERIARWVNKRLRKVPTASLPNALQVLEMKQGDCNEHAVLFAALARAAGIPTRVVAGIVYADGGFLYHAWNEVWLGQGWVTVDATFDQFPADATHVKLVEGGPEVHDRLLQVIGRLSVDVLRVG